MELSTKIQVVIKQDTQYGEFVDALYFTPDEYKKLTPADIKDKAQKRVDNWIASITNPPAEDE